MTPHKSRWWRILDPIPRWLHVLYALNVLLLLFYSTTGIYRNHLWPFSPERVEVQIPGRWNEIDSSKVSISLDEDDVRRMIDSAVNVVRMGRILLHADLHHCIDSALHVRDSVAKAEAGGVDTVSILQWRTFPAIIIGDTIISPTKPPYNWNRFRGRKP